MLVTLKEILELAEKNSYAIGAFNTPNLENLTAVLDCAQELQVPVIIAHAQVHEAIMPLEVIGPIMVLMAKAATVPVCVHLDHGEDLSYLQRALELGFTSIMYDGSLLSFQENVKNTKLAVEMANKTGASVEAEIGVMQAKESDETSENSSAMFTDPEMAGRFVNETKIDALAASFGTVHGIYREEPKLDFDRIQKIKETTGLPIVMHGGSGVSEPDYKKAIKMGVRKINYYSYMSREGVYAVKKCLEQGEVTYYHVLAKAATEAMKEDVKKAMKVFCHVN